MPNSSAPASSSRRTDGAERRRNARIARTGGRGRQAGDIDIVLNGENQRPRAGGLRPFRFQRARPVQEFGVRHARDPDRRIGGGAVRFQCGHRGGERAARQRGASPSARRPNAVGMTSRIIRPIIPPLSQYAPHVLSNTRLASVAIRAWRTLQYVPRVRCKPRLASGATGRLSRMVVWSNFRASLCGIAGQDEFAVPVRKAWPQFWADRHKWCSASRASDRAAWRGRRRPW